MRRVTASLLLAVLANLIAPADVWRTSQVPACCRRSGAHHCHPSSETSSPGLKATQPACPVQQCVATPAVSSFIPRLPVIPPQPSLHTARALSPANQDYDPPAQSADYERGPPTSS